MRSNHSRRSFFLLGAIFVALILLYAGWHFESTHEYGATVEKKIQVEDTTWEFVEYTDGPNVENLVGTDWILQFDNSTGLVRLCDTYTFSFFTSPAKIQFMFDNLHPENCQKNVNMSEALVFDILQNNPTILRTASPTKVFTEVLVFSSGNKKLVLVPRNKIDLSNKRSHAQKVQLIAQVCTQDVVQNNADLLDCASLPFSGFFSVATVDSSTQKVSYEVATDMQGKGEVALPIGSYQIELKEPTSDIVFPPMIFSITQPEKNIKEIPLFVYKK